ncbi:MAG: antitoxin [Planctomycetota bacterium]|jgi:antitoxin VapB|nr:antitoxin [Planctomycetota bacterium]
MTRVHRVGEPVSGYVADDDRALAKLFPNGRSQAIRLPKAFRMPGESVWIHREGRRLIIEPLDEGCDDKGWPHDLWAQLDELMDGHDIPEVEPMGAGFLELDPDQVNTDGSGGAA